MAQLAEVTYLTKSGVIPYKTKITGAEVHQYDEATLLTLHEAKTAKPGEVQVIKLWPMKGPLCPVQAVERRLVTMSRTTDSLFGYRKHPHHINLTKRQANTVLQAAWAELGRKWLSSHSFRVGEATIRHAMRVSVDNIQTLGRWTLECYQLYVKPFTQDAKDISLFILQNPNLV